MNFLYILLNIGSLSIPFLFSFHPKLKFYNYWRALSIAIVITMFIFIPWDIVFTKNGFWGFNDSYYLGYKILGLPIEEWLFFICIPYACVFTHYALLYYFPNIKLSKKSTKIISITLLLLLIVATLLNTDRWYTLVNFGYAIVLISIVLKTNIELLQHYFLTFLVMLIPFFIVNGILTGTGIENEVVWYNNNENLDIRILTIPAEDTVYAFTLILTNLVVLEYFQKKYFKRKEA